MKTVPFAEWLPDLPALRNPGSTNIKNCLPYMEGYYLPFNALTTISNAIDSQCRGAISVKDTSGNVYTYLGCTAKLQEVTGGALTVTDRSGATYTTGSSEFWKMAKWGNKVIATNFNDNPQAITIAGASNFADLGGSPPKAKHIAIVRDFVVLANLDESGTKNPIKLRWSGINDETAWTTSATTQSDTQILQTSSRNGGGVIMDIKGGNYGTIFQEHSIWRMEYVGSPAVFSFDEVLPGRGTPARNSVVQHGNTIFYLDNEGFYALINGTELYPIGAGKVDKTFLAELDTNYYGFVIGAIDPFNQIVMWAYPGAGSANGVPNKIIAYNWYSKRWTQTVIDTEWIFTGYAGGYTLEQLDNVSSSLDALLPSLDSSYWVDGSIQLSAVDTSHKLSTFTGSALAATLETSEFGIQEYMGQETPHGDKRIYVSAVRPIIDGTATVAPKTRNLQTSDPTTGTAVSQNSETGICHLRSDARYQRLQVVTSGDFTHAQGVDVEARPSGAR